MIRETYKGRKLQVVKAGSGLVGFINGQPMPARYGVPEREIIEQFHRDINYVNQLPIDGGRWGAYMYAPGTYELCENDHAKAPGEPCRHSYCQQAARRPDGAGGRLLGNRECRGHGGKAGSDEPENRERRAAPKEGL